MLLDHTAKGVYAIAVTPFKPDGALDYDSVDRMTDFYLGCGVTGLTHSLDLEGTTFISSHFIRANPAQQAC